MHSFPYPFDRAPPPSLRKLKVYCKPCLLGDASLETLSHPMEIKNAWTMKKYKVPMEIYFFYFNNKFHSEKGITC